MERETLQLTKSLVSVRMRYILELQFGDLLRLAAPKERHLGFRVDSPSGARYLHRVDIWFRLHHVQTSLRNCKTETTSFQYALLLKLR
jgi:hypothetical protein